MLTAAPVAAVVVADGVATADSLVASVEADSTVVDLEEVEDLVETAVVVPVVEVTGTELTEVATELEVTLPGLGSSGDEVAEVGASAVLGTGTLPETPGVMVAMETSEYDVCLKQVRQHAHLHQPE